MRQGHPEELLAFHVNGLLEGDERKRVAQHVSACGRCRDEVGRLEALRHRAPGGPPGRPEAEVELAGAAERAAGGSSRGDRRAAPAWWRPALAAGAIIIVLEGAILAVVVARQGGLDPLGTPAAGVVLEVTFAPDATEAAIRAALAGVNGRIVDGPSPIGVYTVRLPIPEEDRAQVEAAVDRLAGLTGVVSHVERN